MYSRKSNIISNDQSTFRLISFIIFTLIFAQRLVVPIGSFQIPVIFFVVYFCIVIILLNKRIKPEKGRLISFYTFTFLAFILFLFNSDASLFSLAFLVFLYIPLIFVFKKTASNFHTRLLKYFQKLMLLAAIIGIVQFTSQYVGFYYQDFFQYLPQNFVQQGYNTSYQIQWGSIYFKSNGVFFLEPSFFSQFLALSLIIEFIYFKRIKNILAYLAALLCTFSGTGLLLLIPFGVITILKLKPSRLVPLVILIIITFSIFLTSEFGRVTMTRVNEFSTPGTSGYIRFVAPFKAVIDITKENPIAIFTGLGPGAVDDLAIGYSANFSAIPKLIIEYGLIATISFLTFLFISFFHKTKSYIISMSLLTLYILLSGNLLQAQTVYLVYILGMLIVHENKNRTTELEKPYEA